MPEQRAGSFVDTTTDQSVGGVKRFSQKLTFRRRPVADAQHPDFGATPGGSATANNTALQAWLDACRTENHPGLLPADPLTYDISETLEFKQKQGWALRGDSDAQGYGLHSTIKWAGAPGLQAPGGSVATGKPALTRTASGGTLAAAYYSYRVTALNATGESMPGPPNCILASANDSVTITWLAPAGAAGVTGYKIYRGVYLTGVDTELLLTTVGNVLTYTDTGALTPAGAMPTTNSSSTGVMFLLEGVQRGVLSHIGFDGANMAKTLVDYNAISGSLVSTLNTFDHVRFANCTERALRIGKSNFQTDQTDYSRCTFVTNYIGVSIEDANAVWHNFVNGCNWSANDIGITGAYAGNGGHFSVNSGHFVGQRFCDIQTYASRAISIVDVHSESSHRFLRGSRSNGASGYPLTMIGCSVNSITCPTEKVSGVDAGRVGIEWANSSPLVISGSSFRGDVDFDPNKNFLVFATGGSRRATVLTPGSSFDGNPFRFTSAAYGMAAVPAGLTPVLVAAATDAGFLGNPLPYLTPATAAAVSATAPAAAGAVGSRWAELSWVKVPSGTVLAAGANLFYWRSNNAVGKCRIEIPTIKTYGGSDSVLLGISGQDNNASTALTVEINVRCSAGFTLTSDMVFAIRLAPEPLTSG